MLGNIGPMELFIILVIVLVVFGAKRVPEIGASIGTKGNGTNSVKPPVRSWKQLDRSRRWRVKWSC